MAVNDLTFNQLSSLLATITSQATGSATITPTNTSEFVSVGQTALKTGYDPVLQSISQVLSRTIFSIRPYTRKFADMMVSNQRYGAITRKLAVADKPFEDDPSYDPNSVGDGKSVDMYKVNAPNVLQLNFYGMNVFEKALTIYRYQLDNAFNNADEFGQFISMIMTNASDMIEQAHENIARACLANFIGGKVLGDASSVVHLLTEYNAVSGLALTATTVYQPDNFKAFTEWVYSRIASISDAMTERSNMYQIQVTNKNLTRHTPYARQRLYLYSPLQHQITSRAVSNTFNDDFVKYGNYEAVNFWQSIKTPNSINVKPTYLEANGTLVTPKAASTTSEIFGVIMDEEAAGYTVVNQWSATTPFNAKGGYSNMYWHFTDKYWNDFTEKGVILLLD